MALKTQLWCVDPTKAHRLAEFPTPLKCRQMKGLRGVQGWGRVDPGTGVPEGLCFLLEKSMQTRKKEKETKSHFSCILWTFYPLFKTAFVINKNGACIFSLATKQERHAAQVAFPCAVDRELCIAVNAARPWTLAWSV